MSNIVAIVGRPNVGKSTLFNRLIGTRKAIVNEESGVTRDRNYGKSHWNGKEFSVIDTGGYVCNSDDIFEEEINKQVLLALDEADVILFMVDAEIGVTDLDQNFARLLRNIEKPIYLVANKVDNLDRMYEAQEFYRLGIKSDLFCISSVSGSGTGDLLDQVISHFREETVEDTDHLPRITIVGRPNVGKSSTINALVGQERNIVTDIAGTTRDTLNTRYTQFGYDFILVDTAGVRKKAKVSEDVEFYSVMRSIRAIEDSDVCMLLIDATRGMEAQDLNIFHLIERNRKGVVLVVNKWDLIEKDGKTMIEYEKELRNKIAFQRRRYHFCLGPDETTTAQNARSSPPRIQKPPAKTENLRTQPHYAGSNRKLSPTQSEREVRQDQIRHPTADTCSLLCILLQPAAICKRPLQTVSRK